MYQRFIAVGRLGRDPQVSTTSGGARMAILSLATSEFVKGEERTEWHRVVVWDEKQIETVERHARKGAMLAVEGQVRTRRWQQKDGQEAQVTEIVLDRFNSRLRVLDRNRDDRNGADRPASAGAETGSAAAGLPADERRARRPEPAAALADAFDDDLPF